MTNLQELSQLATVINQMKTIINSSGSLFTKPQVVQLRNQAVSFEKKFVDSALKLDLGFVEEQPTKAKIVPIVKDGIVAIDPNAELIALDTNPISMDEPLQSRPKIKTSRKAK